MTGSQGKGATVAGKHVLVVGDVMIDSTWLVGGTTPGGTSTPHFGIERRRLIRPPSSSGKPLRTDVLGGAGSAVRWLLAADPAVYVKLLGAWAPETKPKLLVPDQPEKAATGGSRKSASARLEPTVLVKTPFTTTKWRLFEYAEGRPALFARFDDDLGPNSYPVLLTSPTWPAPTAVDVVVVDDFDKGLLSLQPVRDELAKYSDKPVLLRAKGDQWRSLPWTVLLCSVPELFRHAGMSGTPVPVTPIKSRGGVHPDLATAISRLKLTTTQHAYVLLDGEGGLLASRDKITVHAIEKAWRHRLAVTARDCFLAHLALELAYAGSLNPTSTKEATEMALRAATLCSGEGAKALHDAGDWYLHSVTQRFDKVRLESIPVEKSVADPTALVLPKTVGGVLKRSQIRLRDADWFLPGYRTVNEAHGRQVAGACECIRAYRAKPTERPLVIAIAAPPAAGKSRLAKSLAEAAGCDLISDRVDAWSSLDDLYHLCEQIRTHSLRGRVPLALLDEVDTKAFGGEKIYARLLAPLWDRCYFSRGEARELGPCVFVLAGSTPEWTDGVAGRRRRGAPPKLADLLSRVETENRVNIPKLADRRVDAVFFVVAEIRRRCPRVKKVAKPLLRVLAEATLPQEARSLERAVAALELDTAKEEVTVDDVMRRLRPVRLLGEVKFPRNWDKAKPVDMLELAD